MTIGKHIKLGVIGVVFAANLSSCGAVEFTDERNIDGYREIKLGSNKEKATASNKIERVILTDADIQDCGMLLNMLEAEIAATGREAYTDSYISYMDLRLAYGRTQATSVRNRCNTLEGWQSRLSFLADKTEIFFTTHKQKLNITKER